MRMTRGRRKLFDKAKRQAERLKESRTAQIGAVLALGALGISLPWSVRADIANIFMDVDKDFSYMQEKSDNLTALDKAKAYLADAAESVGITQENLMAAARFRQRAEEAVNNAIGNQKKAEDNLNQLRKQVQAAKVEVNKCIYQTMVCRQEVDDYYYVWAEAQNGLNRAIANYNEAADNPPDFSDVTTENELLEVQTGYISHLEGLISRVKAAEYDFYTIDSTYEELQNKLELAQEDELDAREELADLEEELAQAKKDLEDAEEAVKSSKEDRVKAQEARFEAELERDKALNRRYDAKQAVEHIDDGDSFTSGMEYYTWKGEGSGHQLYESYSYNHSDENVNIDMTTGRIKSDTGLANGKMSGWTDTLLDVYHWNKHPLFDVRYGMSFNIPTGSSRTHTNAIVPVGMARFDRMGEGWNFTPELEIRRHIDHDSTVSWRTAYSLRGKYNDSIEDGESWLNPGNRWSNELEYLNLGGHTQFMARMGYVIDNSSSLNGQRLREGNQFYTKMYYKNWVNGTDAYLGYLGYINQQAGDFQGGGVNRLLAGGGWEHRLDDNSSVKLMLNWMNSSGDSYDPVLRRTYLAGRRVSVSLGYDWHISSSDSVSVNVERFVDNNKSGSDYQGWQTSLMFRKSF